MDFVEIHTAATLTYAHFVVFYLFVLQLHEVGHVLGIGPMWQKNGLIPSFRVPCPYKTDSAASREYQELSGCTGAAIPVEMSFNPLGGSNCGHWQEQCFQKELMSPTASTELTVSRITIAGLEDLGYEVDYEEAEPYDSSHMNPACLCNENRLRRRTTSTTSEEARQLLEEGTLAGFINNNDNNTTNMAPTRRRELSEEGRSAAMSYGKDVLAMRRDSMSLFPLPDTVYNLGEDVIFVIYEENETVHSVVVTSDSL